MVAHLAASAATALIAVLALAGAVSGRSSVDVRVTVFGDSAATAMAYDPDAKRVMSVAGSTSSWRWPRAGGSVTQLPVRRGAAIT